MAKYVVRRMRKTDLKEIVALENEIFSDPWSYQAFQSDLENGMAYPIVSLAEDTLVGYASLYVVAGEMQIGNLAVAPSCRRKGIARNMMHEIINIARKFDCACIYLEVRESNYQARNLYGSCEFKVIGQRNGYYRNPSENAILMAREL
jgi:ribosomal-protein-alanine N-acetyltransferase